MTDRLRSSTERTFFVLVGLAAVVLLLMGLTGIAEPVYWGHYGYHIGEMGQAARTTLRHGVLGPAPTPGHLPPMPENFAMHHPFFVHHPLLVLGYALFGDHVWSGRWMIVWVHVATVIVLGLVVRKHWGFRTAVLACFLYVLTPMTVAFAQLPDNQPTGILGCLIGLAAYASFVDVPDRRRVAWTWMGFLIALGSDWTSFLVGGLVGIHCWLIAIVRFKTRPRFLRLPVDFWLGLGLLVIAVGVATAFFWYSSTHAAGGLHNMIGAYSYRATGAWSTFIEQQKKFVGGVYGWLALGLGGLAILRVLARTVLGRSRPRDLISMFFILGSIVRMLLFREEANVHVYRSEFFALPLAILLAELGLDFGSWLGALTRRALLCFQCHLDRRLARVVVLVPGLLLVAHTADRAAWMLKESRRVGGTLFHGDSYNPQLEKMAVARHLNEITSLGDMVYIDRALEHRLEVLYSLDRTPLPGPSVDGLLKSSLPKQAKFAWFDMNTLSTRDQKRLIERFDVQWIDRYWIVRLSSPEDPPRFRRFVFDRRPKGLLESWLAYPVHSPLIMREDEAAALRHRGSLGFSQGSSAVRAWPGGRITTTPSSSGPTAVRDQRQGRGRPPGAQDRPVPRLLFARAALAPFKPPDSGGRASRLGHAILRGRKREHTDPWRNASPQSRASSFSSWWPEPQAATSTSSGQQTLPSTPTANRASSRSPKEPPCGGW